MTVRRLRHVAPAGAPIGLWDLARWAGTLITDAAAIDTLCRTVADRTGAGYCGSTCTGRAAMTVLLRALKRAGSDGRDEVIIPAYTCYSVAAAVVRAGLKPRIVDINPLTLDYDWATLENADARRSLAVIGTNLYGIPNDMPRLAAFARQRRLFLVDDAAQALGASVGGRLSGTWGDAGIYSFDKGKNISAIDGGLIVSSNEAVVRALRDEAALLPQPKSIDVVQAVIKLAAYAAMLRPSLYWIPNAIPQLGLGRTVYDTSFAVERYNRPLAALALAMLRRLDQFTAARRANAEWLKTNLADTPGVAVIQPPADSQPVYLRFPVLISSRDLRDELLEKLNDAGIGATASYPRSLIDLDPLSSYPMHRATPAGNGSAVADRILTLPTHPGVARQDLERIADVIRTVSRRHAAVGAFPSVEAIA